MGQFDLFPILKEDIDLREEENGAVLINKAEDDFMLLSPFEGFIYSLFNGRRTISDIVQILKKLKNTPNNDEEIFDDINNLINNRPDLIEFIETPTESDHIGVDPFKFLFKKRDLYTSPIRLDSPISAELYVTRRCNLNCIYCFADANCNRLRFNADQSNEMSLGKIESIIDEFVELGIRSVTITGGEATLRADLPRIIRRLLKYGIKVLLPTNAYSMTDEDAKILRDAGLKEVQAKLDAANPEIQDRLTRVKGSHNRLVNGISILKAHSFKVSTVSVITSQNIKEFPEVVRLCSHLGVDEVIPRIYTPGVWSQFGRGGAYLNPSRESIVWLDNVIKELQKDYKDVLKIAQLNTSTIKKNIEREMPMCPGFISSFVILENGLVVPCEMMADSSDEFVIGDVNKDKLIDIWKSEKAEKWVLRKDVGIGGLCISCDEFSRCKAGCAWKAIVSYGNWLCDPTCIKAPKPTHIPFAEVPS